MSIRHFESGDLSGVVSLLEKAMPGEGISEGRFVRQVLLDGNFRAEGMPVAVEGGEVVGLVLAVARQVALENAVSDAERGYITLLAVRPECRRQGIGAALLERAELYLRGQGRKFVMISSYAPGYFIPGVDVAAYGEALSFLSRRGYAEVYRPIAMECALWKLDVPGWVEEKQKGACAAGLAFEAWRGELALPVLEFVRREFPGDWVRVVRGVMERIVMGEPATRLFVCHDGKGTVVGFSHYEGERFGPIGTAAAMRGKGIGQVLMYKTLRAQRETGLRAAWFLWSDDKTAGRIYSGAGFREVRRFALLKKEL